MSQNVTSQTVVGGLSGLVLGGFAGAFLGRSLEKRERTIPRGTATELGAIFGGITGAVLVAAVVVPRAQT
jgi:outer membrane lipoprotein SlyB